MRYKFIVIALGLLAATYASCGETQTNWTARFSELKANAAREFVPHRIGDEVSIVLTIGGERTGTLIDAGRDSVTIMHAGQSEVIPRDRLTTESQMRLFQDAFAESVAKQRLNVEQNQQYQAEIKQREADRVAEVQRQEKQAELAAREATETKRRGAIRVVDGCAYDFGDVIVAYNTLLEAIRVGPNGPDPQQSLEAIVAARKVLSVIGGKYIINGSITQVLPDGLLVNSGEKRSANELVDAIADFDNYEGIVHVTNYSRSEDVVDGQRIVAFGIPKGRYQYTNTLNAVSTVVEFHCGRRLAEGEVVGVVSALPE